MTQAYINRIATAVPPHDVHEAFLSFAHSLIQADRRKSELFVRMAGRSEIEHRYSYLAPLRDPEGVSVFPTDFYKRDKFPNTAARMRLFNYQAPLLAELAVERLNLGDERNRVSHVLITCCTGFSAPGLDLEIMARCRLPHTIERTMIGFMGCYAAINALKLARHIVRSGPNSRVLVINLELCSLHLQETTDLGQILSYLLFGDGCAASVVSAEPVGLAIDRFHAMQIPDTRDLITWNIGDSGFDMVLSGQVPATIQEALRSRADEILAGIPASSIGMWGVHPGGRSVLDAVERAFDLGPRALSASRDVLRRYGNMSSPTVMFVLERLMRSSAKGATGCAMSFGPGLTAETMLFHAVSHINATPRDPRVSLKDNVFA